MSKATILADLYKKSVQEYTKTPGEWMGLLSCVAKFYKRSFDNAVLVYAQKPNAAQLATFDEWHDKRINRNINRGAKGIAVIDMANPNASIKYLFDFMDTNGSERSLKNLLGFMWEVEEQYRPSLMIKFHERYMTPTSSIEACLYKLVSKKVADILPQYMENFKIHDESSMLYGLPIEAVKAEFAQIVTDSVAYTVFSKCGISTEIFEENAFEQISHFNSLELFMALGSCTVSLARPILKEIHQEIQNIKIERSQIYENRTLNDPELHAGRGRNDVSRPPNLAEPGHGRSTGGQIRESVEGLHGGTSPTPPVGTGVTGQNQRGDTASGRGSADPQGSTDTAATHHPADAGYRGHDGESRPHDDADPDRRGNRDERTGDESQVAPPQLAEPPTDGKKPSVGGFFVVPPKTEKEVAPRGETENAEQIESVMSFPYRLLGRLQSDCDYFLGAGQGHEKHLWAGSVKAQIAKMWELYDSVPEKPEWLTEQDIKRYEQQMVALQTEIAIAAPSIPPVPAVEETADQDTTPIPPPTELSDEEISDLMDVVLCADDITSDTREWLSEINEFFQGGHKLSSKGHVLKAFYGKLDTDYTTKTGEYLHITAAEDGLTLLYEGNTLLFTYKELAEKIELLILHGIYPFSTEDSMIDDYAIPDEVEQMNGVVDDDEWADETPLVIVENKLDAVDRGYLQTVLQNQSLSLYLQATIQDFFAGEHDTELRTAFVKKTYGWGHREFEAGGIQYRARTFDDGMHIQVIGPLESTAIHATWEQVTENIEVLIENETYVNPNPPEPPNKREVIDRIITKYSGSGKQQVFIAMTTLLSSKDRIDVLKGKCRVGGSSRGLENGGHERINYDGKGIEIDYSHDGVEFKERLSWSAVEKRIGELIKQDAYLTVEEKADLALSLETVALPEPEPPTATQMTLFGTFGGSYEDSEGEDNDSLLDGNSAEPAPLPFAEGDRIFYQDRVYEILKYLHDGLTVEIGDIAQLENHTKFAITERVPITAIADCQLLQDYYTEGEIASMVVKSVQSGDHSEETVDAIKAATIINNVNDQYSHAIVGDFIDRSWGEGLNYRYSPDHHLYDGGPKTKCQNNIAAIRLLKELQEQGRPAMADEQITLAKFVGWGGLANALTPGKAGWEQQYEEIKSLLTDEEFQAAQESTLTAYYTEQSIISHIYKGLERFGFRGGNILDPAMGTGNFYSALPDSMADSKLYGTEIEPISGNIAKHLYPTANIQVMGFEHTKHPDHFFDVVVGNVPFNSIKVDDPRYNKHNFRIHDYFLAKSIDKTRPGGIVAVIISKYTMDKANSNVRKYIAQRAELLGAIRLPNNAFKQVAGTEATTDILFLKKREREIVPDTENSPWLSIEENENGIPINSYFIDHPEMVLGKMVFDESMFGNEKTTACHPIEGDSLEERLERAVSYLEGSYTEATSEYEGEKEALPESRPADANVRNYSYTVVDDELYFQENSRMYKQNITGRKAERIRGMIEITHAVRRLIDFQNSGYADLHRLPTMEYDKQLQEQIAHLNTVYDRYVKEYGTLNSYGNIIAFSRDSNAPLIRSIEQESKNEKGVWEKTPMFYRATIKPKVMPSVVHSAEEALKVSLNVKGKVDLDYMSWLYQLPEHRKATPDEIIAELGERIYQDPDRYMGNPHAGWQTADEYLSGYVKDKLMSAILKAEDEPERFRRNVDALKLVQPVPLTPEEIGFTLGSTWIPVETYQDFMHETFKTMDYNRTGHGAIALSFSNYSGAYNISYKSGEKNSVTVNQTYGTDRMNAYEILESTLNLRSVEIKDPVDYIDPATGEEKTRYVLNKKETILAREKQAEIKMAFESWLFADPERGTHITKLYNDIFNNIRPREYNGDDLIFPDMSEDITLRKHQRDVVAHGLYGDGNLLMAHEVGAGKTYAASALAYEFKRLGKCHKPLFAVPNHLVGQWADAYMKLYPNANILVAEKKDFERKNRRRFVSRIATGEYDAIIMAHSSFELIGLSRERQLAAMKAEIDGITNAIAQQKAVSGKDWSLKQMKIFQSNMQYRYDRLFKAEKKDDVINFEELGVDALIVDEAHVYKNNFSYTKMRNVAGVSGASSQRAMDMHQKCQYINEIGNGKGVVYLTGTPVSNTMAELYVLQKTLQPKELERKGLLMFDSWASTYGKVVSSLEIKPEGSGYQMKNRFAKFYNLPELMSMFMMVADIKTADMLTDIPIPELATGAVQVVKSVCTPEQKRIVMELAERAENIRSGEVDSSEDNFLKLTHDARLLSVDPRILDPELPDDPNTKLNICARNVAKIYHETAENRLTQLIFCDQGTPKNDGSFNFYDATKEALIAQGVEESEIAYIHDAKTDVQREQLFEKVRRGEIRVLMGSTEKMGTGMNVQEKLVSLHHLDIPWRPADLTQRNGRILRQGNENDEVSIFTYITENTFDAYLYQILEQKQRYISQIMTGRSPMRSCEDIDDTVLQYAEFKALATSDPRVKEKMETDNEISRLTVLKSSWQSQRNGLQQDVAKNYPQQIASSTRKIEGMTADLESYSHNKPPEFQMVIDGKVHTERTVAAEHLMVLSRKLGKDLGDTLDIGTYAGFGVSLYRSSNWYPEIIITGKNRYSTEMGEAALGNITRLENLAGRIEEMKEDEQRLLNSRSQQLDAAKEELEKPFIHEERLSELQRKKVELDLALEFKDDGEDMLDGDGDSNTPTLEQKLYQKLMVFAAPILNSEAHYMKLKSDGFEDLVLEDISGGEYSIAHYYKQNGDSMRDPEITFTIDHNNKSIHPTSFQQDDVGLYYATEDVTPARVHDLKEFMEQWFSNIKDQGFEPVDVRNYEQENEAEDEFER